MKRIICVFLCLFAIAVSQTYAMEVTFDRDTNTVSISGTAEKNEHIAIFITDASVTDPGKATAADIKAHSIGFYEANADADGNYSISFKTTKAEGEYNFFVSGAETRDKIKSELYKKADVDSALSTLSEAAASGEAKVAEELKNEQFRKLLGINELYNKLPDKSILAAVIAKNNYYGSYSELNNAIESIKVMQDFCERFNAMINKAQVKDHIIELQSLYGGDGAVYTKYFGLKSTDSIDKTVFGKRPFETISDVYNAFALATEAYSETPVNNGAFSGGGGGGGGRSGGSGGSSGGGFSVAYPTGAVSADESLSGNGTNNAGSAGGANSAQTFSDVGPEHWGYTAIEELYKMGIVSGVSSDKFAPDKPVKREEFVKMLVMLTGLEPGDEKDTFTDTDKSAWYSPYLAIARECGLVFGREDGSFGIGEVLTRQDMAVLTARVLGSTERGTADEFTDEYEISDYAKSSVAILCGLNVISGMGDGRFAPKETATRAQAAKVIYESVKIMN